MAMPPCRATSPELNGPLGGSGDQLLLVFGFTNFDNYRIRALLYAGKPNWALLETLTPT